MISYRVIRDGKRIGYLFLVVNPSVSDDGEQGEREDSKQDDLPDARVVEIFGHAGAFVSSMKSAIFFMMMESPTPSMSAGTEMLIGVVAAGSILESM